MTSISQLIQCSDTMDADTLEGLRTLIARYPFCALYRLLMQRNLYVLRDASFADELKHCAIYAPDRTVLYDMVMGTTWQKQKTDAPLQLQTRSDRTMSLIDSFLETQEDMPTDMCLEPTDDYITLLGAMENTEPETSATSRTLSLIDNYLQSPEKPLLDLSASDPEEPGQTDETISPVLTTELPETLWTESMAQNFIRQRKYQKALDIIKHLNLQEPQKSTYFAVQIRYLERLIANDKLKNK